MRTSWGSADRLADWAWKEEAESASAATDGLVLLSSTNDECMAEEGARQVNGTRSRRDW